MRNASTVSRKSRSTTNTDTKRRLLRALPLVLLDDATRIVIFLVDLVLLIVLACSAIAVIAPGFLDNLVSR